jgi:hypothetical protein
VGLTVSKLRVVITLSPFPHNTLAFSSEPAADRTVMAKLTLPRGDYLVLLGPAASGVAHSKIIIMRGRRDATYHVSPVFV